ncbi:MAG: hypothetical protein RSB09_02885, partial [Clostridia bacterium]
GIFEKQFYRQDDIGKLHGMTMVQMLDALSKMDFVLVEDENDENYKNLTWFSFMLKINLILGEH